MLRLASLKEGIRRTFALLLALSLVLAPLAALSPPLQAGDGVWTRVDLAGLRIQAMAVDPTNQNILFAGTNGSGIFRSTDGGVSWVNVNVGLGNLVVNDIAIDPSNPSVVLAATGRGGLVGEETAGIYRSTSRGDIWSFQAQGSADALAFDPTNPRVVYAAGAPPVRKSTDGGVAWFNSFEPNSVLLNNEPRGIAVDPENPNVVLAAGNTEGGTGQVFRSADGGATWSFVLDNQAPILDVAFAPPAAPGSVAFFANLVGVFRSTDGGRTFARVTEELGDVTVRDVLVNPLDPNSVVGATQNRGVSHSTDGGATWSELDGTLGNRDVFSLAIDMANPQSLYAGTADGPWAFTFAALPGLTLSPTSGPPGTVVRFAGSGFTPAGRVTVALVRGLGIIVAEVTADPNGGISGSFTMPDPARAAELRFGPVDVFAIDRTTGRETPPAFFLLTQPVAPTTTVFFAEGATTPPFDTWFLVQNPGPSPATLTFTFQLLGGGTVVRSFTTGPTARFSLFANQVLPNQAFSTRIDSTQPIFAERAMFVSFDGHVVTQINAPARLWLFAEGATAAPFHTWLLLQNPNAQAARATITYLLEGGGTRTQVLTLPPSSRTSVFVNEVLPNAAFASRVESDLPIIAERAMYRFPGNAATGVAGVQSAARTWFFAEGATSVSPFGFDARTDTWLLLQNPNNTPVPVTITLFDTAGNTARITQTVAPLARLGVFLNSFTSLSSFAIRVEASAPVIAERAMYFGEEPRGAHATVGSPELATVWNLAEGSTAPPFDEVIALLNPTDQNMSVTMEFFLEGGQTVVRQFSVGPNRKFSIDVDAIVPSAAVSARVSTSIPTVVERTMFFLKDGNLGAHNTIGIR